MCILEGVEGIIDFEWVGFGECRDVYKGILRNIRMDVLGRKKKKGVGTGITGQASSSSFHST